jgi:hypothetical protein
MTNFFSIIGMKKKNFLLLIILVVITTGCAKKNIFRIEGTIAEGGKKTVYLSKVDVNTIVPVDSAKINSSGRFRFIIRATGAEFYQLSLSKDNFITLLAEPGERINLTFPGELLYRDYSVSGSPGSKKIKTLDSALAVTKRKADSLMSVYQKSLNEPDFKVKEEQINLEYVNLLKEQRKFNITFILQNLNSLATIMAIYQKIDESTFVLYDSRDLQFLKLATDTLSRYYPDSKQVKALKSNFEKEYGQARINRITEAVKNAEPAKLDPVLKDLNGKTIALSSLTGKYVLLAFWSAASSDCLAENLQLKDYYRKYHPKGFEIYQINLDTDEELWRQAVKFDELPWISVREDDPLRPKNAILFNVRTLPSNFLFDMEGNIIASNLHDKGLQIKLTQIFGN